MEGGSSTSRTRAEVVIYVIQSKITDGFAERAVDLMDGTLRELLDLDQNIDELRAIYNEGILSKFSLIRNAYVANASIFPSIEIHVIYASRGSHPGPKPERKALQLQESIGGMFSLSTCEFEFLTPSKLITRARRQRPSVLELKFSDAISANGESIVGLVTIAEYSKFVADESGVLRGALFESNVRDYEGNSSINASIRSTLAEKSPHEDFWWLNNGVTIVATRVAQHGKRVSIDYPQIVNGLQTTREIFEFIDGGAVDTSKLADRSLLVRVIVPVDGASRDKIIRATNSQTTIPSVALRATDSVQRDIEEYFLQYGYFYERRSKRYQNEGKPIDRIVSIPYLAEAVLAVLLNEPHLGSPRVGGRFLRDEEIYRRVFNPDIPLSRFLKSVEVLKRVEWAIRSYRLEGESVAPRMGKGRSSRYRLMVSMAVALDRGRGTLDDLDANQIEATRILDWSSVIRGFEDASSLSRRATEPLKMEIAGLILNEVRERRKIAFMGDSEVLRNE